MDLWGSICAVRDVSYMWNQYQDKPPTTRRDVVNYIADYVKNYIF